MANRTVKPEEFGDALNEIIDDFVQDDIKNHEQEDKCPHCGGSVMASVPGVTCPHCGEYIPVQLVDKK